MGDLVRDLRFALRRFRKSPGFSLSAVLVLALGVGASTAMFSVVKSALLEPWPYAGSDRIVLLRGSFPTLGRADLPVFSAAEFDDLRQQTQVFEHVLAGVARNVNLLNGSRPDRVRGAALTASAFDMLGVPPLLGRALRDADNAPGAARVAVVSYRFWKNRLGSDPNVIGRSLNIEGTATEIVGVMPRQFVFWDRDLWVPLELNPSLARRDVRDLFLQATLRKGIGIPQAEAALRIFATTLAGDHPENREYQGWSITLRPLLDDVLRDARPALYALLGAVLLLLIIGCANVASMTLVQATSRQVELAIRSALGASSKDIARQLLIEGMVLSVSAGVLGAVLAVVAVPLIAASLPYGYIPAEAYVHVDATALVIAAGVSVALGAAIAWAPAAQVSATNLFGVLREGGVATGTRRRRRSQRVLLIGQVALAVVILSGAGLMLRSFQRIVATDRGFRAEQVLIGGLPLAADKYRGPGESVALYQEILRRVRTMPGAATAALASGVPTGAQESRVFRGDTQTPSGIAEQDADFLAVSPEYFALLQAPLVAGRAFSEEDAVNAPAVAIVNEAMAARLWPGGNALGRRLASSSGPDVQRVVTGVARNLRGDSLLAPPRPAVYVPWTQAEAPRRMVLLLKTKANAAATISALRREIAAVDSELPLYLPQTLEEAVSDLNGPQRLAAVLLSAFALVALLLSVFGIYAAISHTVAQRRIEMGIRLALGASTRHVLRTVMADGVRILVVGLAIGLSFSISAGRILAGLLYDVGPTDPGALAAVAVLLSAAVLLASYVPARRACWVDPATALR